MSALFDSLIEPRLCALLPTISKGPIKPRFCTTCGKYYVQPYACLLNRYRQVLTDPDREGKGKGGDR